eukprot:Protomagalhaensia_wolfi_Nauph_80__3405@NODE_3460_length_793_cov_47_262599_g2719_i0_p1_GENE_NODE_3460_length_793_cov_47_262599_g2719_i0NODE_3460_length_793_cov_47_262599_g2719_i0_p1_ORF_typecomplete_len206_score4_86DUF4080/PF13311_6/0_17_NODE_3460_length_793_cov_47_262599_g2719_i084701
METHDRSQDTQGDVKPHNLDTPVWPISKQLEHVLIVQLQSEPASVFRIILGNQLVAGLLSYRPLLLSHIIIALNRLNTSCSTLQSEKLFQMLLDYAEEQGRVLQINEVIATLMEYDAVADGAVAVHEKCVSTMSSQVIATDSLDTCFGQWAQLYSQHGRELLSRLSPGGRQGLLALSLGQCSSSPNAVALYEHLLADEVSKVEVA